MQTPDLKCECGHLWSAHYQDGCTFKLGRARNAYCECIETGLGHD